VRNAIKSALVKPAVAKLSLEAEQNENNVNVNFTIYGALKNSCLNIAIVQKQAKSNVKRGENANRVLSHFQIVHQLHSVDLSKAKKGKTSIHLSKKIDLKEFEIIGFVQDMKTGQILGVNKVILQQQSL